jgi:hypothetical protein
MATVELEIGGFEFPVAGVSVFRDQRGGRDACGDGGDTALEMTYSAYRRSKDAASAAKPAAAAVPARPPASAA